MKKGSKKKATRTLAGQQMPVGTPFRLQEPVYKATLKVLGHVYHSEGKDTDEVLKNFKTEQWVKGAGVLTIEKDGIIKEKILSGNHIKNLFGMASGTMRGVSLKFVRQLF